MLMRTEPTRGLDLLTQAVWGPQGRPAMPMTVYRDKDTFVVHIDLPGISLEAIDATVERNVLTVRAERSSPVPAGGGRLLEECSFGPFSRQLVLGDTPAVDDLSARYEDGVLTLTIPIAEPPTPRKVEIGNSEGVNGVAA